jgi:hypothetical protein
MLIAIGLVDSGDEGFRRGDGHLLAVMAYATRPQRGSLQEEWLSIAEALLAWSKL